MRRHFCSCSFTPSNNNIRTGFLLCAKKLLNILRLMLQVRIECENEFNFGLFFKKIETCLQSRSLTAIFIMS